MIFAFLANNQFHNLEDVEKGFNLVPKAKTTSAFEINSIAAFDPLYPNGPTAKRMTSWKTIIVLITRTNWCI